MAPNDCAAAPGPEHRRWANAWPGIFDLLNTSSHAVKYGAATTLTLLTQNPAAMKGSFPQSQSALTVPLIAFVAAASTFVNLIVMESDDNVKRIVLDRREALRANRWSHHGRPSGSVKVCPFHHNNIPIE
jgi:hypothetical protein